MATTLVGAAVTGTGVTTLAMSPATIGNAIGLYIKIPSAIHTVSPGGVSDTKGTIWQRVAGPFVDTDPTPHTHEIWVGTVIATGATTITVTNTGGLAMDLDGQEATAGLGANTSWLRDGTQSGLRDNASSVTITYPTLTPAASAWYIGHARCPTGSSYSGTTAGYTSTTDANGNQFINHPSIGAPSSPTATSSIATLSHCIGVLIKAAATTPAPTVTAVSPVTGATGGTTTVTITGTNFTGASAVKFGATNATSFTVDSATQITAIAPAHAAGAVDVTVTTAGGTSATGAPDTYTFAVIAVAPFPTLILEWSPTTSPAQAPVWVDITSRLRRFSISRGRRNWLSTMNPGTATFDLDNTDLAGTSTAGPFTPSNSSAANYPNMVPGKRVRLRAVAGGITYPRFSGFTVGYPTSWKNTDSQVTFDCVDGLGLLSLVSLNAAYAQTVLLDGPSVYHRFLETSGTIAADSSGNGLSGTYIGGITFSGIDPITDGSDHAITLDGTTGYLTSPLRYAGGAGGPLTIELWIKTAVTGNPQYLAATTAGTFGPSLQLPGGTAPVMYGIGVNATGPSIPSDNAWHHIVGTIDGAGKATCYVDGVAGMPSGAGTTNGVTGTYTFGWSLGGTFFQGSFAELAVYPTALSADRVLAHYNARNAWINDTSSGRVTHIADVISWLASDRNIGTGTSVLVSADDLAGKSALAAINDAATTENGLVFIDQSGRLTFIGRNALQTTAPYNVSQGTFGDNVAEIAYPMGDGKINLDDQDLWTQIAVQRKGGSLFVVTSPKTTVDKFYTVRRPSTVNTLTNSETEALQLGNWLLAQSSTPLPRVDTLNMKGTAGNLASILARELGDLITYKGRPAGVGTVSQQARILGMKESGDLKERIWRTSWLLFAREPQSMVWDDPTYGKWDTYPWGI